MFKHSALLLFTTTLAAGSAAYAQETGQTTVSLGLSSFGGNLEAAYQIDPQWRARGALMGGVNFDGTQTENGATFDLDASLGALALIADYYPTGSGWRVSAGIVKNNTSIKGTATADNGSSFEIDGTTYTSGSVTTTATFTNKFAPMVTTGYDYSFGNSWMVSGEIGAIYTGGITLTSTGSDATLQNAIDSSTEYTDARDEASKVKLYPYIGISVGYSF